VSLTNNGASTVPVIEDYALIGDCETAALVSRQGSIDWPEHGRWQLAPSAPVTSVRRRYLGDTAILETEFTTADGVVALIDFMRVRSGLPDCYRSSRTSAHGHGHTAPG
jgi:GH15 family glucan-1,4-alpha-glucosidase